MNDVAKTIAAGPRVLLLTHGEYSYYEVDFVLLAPDGRDPETDLKEYEAHVARRAEEIWRVLADESNAAGHEVMERTVARAMFEERKRLDTQRRGLPKDTPERVGLWHRVKAMGERLDADDRLNTKLRYKAHCQVWNQIRERYGAHPIEAEVGSACEAEELGTSAICAYFTKGLGYSECKVCES